MPLYGFNDRNTAKRLKQIANTLPPALDPSLGLEYTDAWFVKSPVGGVPAIDGTTLGSAVCPCYKLTYDEGTGEADLAPMTDSDGAAISVTVHHAGTKAIGAEKFLIVARIFGLYVPIVEYC